MHNLDIEVTTPIIVVAVASWLVSYSMYVKWSKASLPTTQLLCWAKHSSSHWTKRAAKDNHL